MDTKTIPAGLFKQQCLALLDQVAATGHELVITKRGRPVARLVPLESPAEHEETILAKLRGSARMLVDEPAFLAPTTDDAGWDLVD